MKFRSPKFWLTVAGIILVLLVVVWGMARQPETELEAYKHDLLARGEKLDYRAFIPPSVPPERNGADIARTAFAIIDDIKLVVTNQMYLSPMRCVAPGRAVVAWQQPDAWDTDRTNTWAAFEAEQVTNEPAVMALRGLLDRPMLDFGLDYNGFATQLPHVAKLKGGAWLLLLGGLAKLHQGNIGEALTNVLAELALLRNAPEPFQISQLVRSAIAQMAFGATWSLLQSTNLTDAQLSSLTRAWEEPQFIAPMGNALQMERALSLQMASEMRASGAGTHRWLGSSFGPSVGSSGSSGSGDWWDFAKDQVKAVSTEGKLLVWRKYLSYDDELRMLKGFQVLVESNRKYETNRGYYPVMLEESNRLAEFNISPKDDWLGLGSVEVDGFNMRTVLSEEADSVARGSRKALVAECARCMVLNAVALRRYELTHGRLPEKLEDLPEPLPPADPIDGKPMRYRRNPDGTFLLYSIGENGTDDGGDASYEAPTKVYIYSWQKGRDWVWPQPATEAEIYFYKTNRLR